MPISDNTRTSVKWTDSTTLPAPIDGFETKMEKVLGGEQRYAITFTPPRNGRVLIFAQVAGSKTNENCGATLRVKALGGEIWRGNDGSLVPGGGASGVWPGKPNFDNYNLRASPAPDSYPSDDAFLSVEVPANERAAIEMYFWNQRATTTVFRFEIVYVPG